MKVSVTIPLQSGRPRLQFPYSPDSRSWLSGAIGSTGGAITWDKVGKQWFVPRTKQEQAIRSLAMKFGRVDIFQHYRESERCDSRCVAATKTDECVCSCQGKNHANGRMPVNTFHEAGSFTLLDSQILVVHRVAYRSSFIGTPEPSWVRLPLDQSAGDVTKLPGWGSEEWAGHLGR